MVRRGSYLFPYDPEPVVQAYTPIFEELAEEAAALRDIWRNIAPVWKPKLQEFLEAEELELDANHYLRCGPVGINLGGDKRPFVVENQLFSACHVLWLLGSFALGTRDLIGIIEALREVIARAKEAVRRLEHYAGDITAILAAELPERKITP